jgi:hypothetical protein
MEIFLLAPAFSMFWTDTFKFPDTFIYPPVSPDLIRLLPQQHTPLAAIIEFGVAHERILNQNQVHTRLASLILDGAEASRDAAEYLSILLLARFECLDCGQLSRVAKVVASIGMRDHAIPERISSDADRVGSAMPGAGSVGISEVRDERVTMSVVESVMPSTAAEPAVENAVHSSLSLLTAGFSATVGQLNPADLPATPVTAGEREDRAKKPESSSKDANAFCPSNGSSGSGNAEGGPPRLGDGSVVIDGDALFRRGSSGFPSGQPKLITDLTGLEEVRELGSSRFGAVRLLRRRNGTGGFDYFAAKFYNAGDNRDSSQALDDRMRPFLELSHPHVMPIVGVIPPTKTAGPVLLTPFSESGSLENVLDRVRRNDAPSFWNDSGKLRMILSLVSGLRYLHSRGIVHRELKPRDLIAECDGSIRICGYATSILEKYRFIKASQDGGPSYTAPEIYDDGYDGAKVRDPKTDVFSFGLILFEIVSNHKVFPSTISAAVIMRRAMSARPSDRAVIPSDVHGVVRELISRS